jgi:hypothetical protein
MAVSGSGPWYSVFFQEFDCIEWVRCHSEPHGSKMASSDVEVGAETRLYMRLLSFDGLRQA